METVTVPRVVRLADLPSLAPGTTKNFWHQRSRFDLIPGQFRCGKRIMVDAEVFTNALRAGGVKPFQA